MRKFYEHVVKYPKLILSIFTVLVIVCGICKPFVSVNYDMNEYLPEETESTVALDKMHEEYTGGIPNARIMLRDVAIAEALSYKEKIEEIDGVSEVTWLDDAQDITKPIEVMDKKMVETYYKDGNALLTVTIEDEKNLQAVEKIREVIGEDNAMTGSAVSTAMATESTVSEISKITIIAVIFVFIVLCLTTTSWVEPAIVLIGLGISVIINGSNLIVGEISFVTKCSRKYFTDGSFFRLFGIFDSSF